MKIEVKDMGKITALVCTGELKTGPGGGDLREKVRELLEKGNKLFLVNMLGVPWLDSGGVGEVVAAGVSIKKAGGTVKLLLSGKAQDIFTMMQLSSVLDVYHDEKSAISAFLGS